MSVPVPPEEMQAAVAEFGSLGFLMTTGADGRPRINHVRFNASGAVLRAGVGGRTRQAIDAQPLVSCLWPGPDAGGMSLIADGNATIVPVEGDDQLVEAVIEVTWAVRHRPPA
ncbi:MAG: hypothetical protein ACKV2O_18005 [Acidimicrobiales bacterium]